MVVRKGEREEERFRNAGKYTETDNWKEVSGQYIIYLINRIFDFQVGTFPRFYGGTSGVTHTLGSFCLDVTPGQKTRVYKVESVSIKLRDRTKVYLLQIRREMLFEFIEFALGLRWSKAEVLPLNCRHLSTPESWLEITIFKG